MNQLPFLFTLNVQYFCPHICWKKGWIQGPRDTVSHIDVNWNTLVCIDNKHHTAIPLREHQSHPSCAAPSPLAVHIANEPPHRKHPFMGQPRHH